MPSLKSRRVVKQSTNQNVGETTGTHFSEFSFSFRLKIQNMARIVSLHTAASFLKFSLVQPREPTRFATERSLVSTWPRRNDHQSRPLNLDVCIARIFTFCSLLLGNLRAIQSRPHSAFILFSKPAIIAWRLPTCLLTSLKDKTKSRNTWPKSL